MAFRFGVTMAAVLSAALVCSAITLSPLARDDGSHASWTGHLAVVDDALATGDVSAAVNAWHDAYGAALATRQWQPMLAVGDAFVRIGAAARTELGARANARQAYLVALTRAKRDRSAAGVLQVAEAFDALSDREVAIQCAQLARRLAEERQDRVVIERARAFTATRGRT